ncbi:hypothetical protein [Saccharothrix deserti]|nr:hypothetical protein [Saccharothrix deserti]
MQGRPDQDHDFDDENNDDNPVTDTSRRERWALTRGERRPR